MTARRLPILPQIQLAVSRAFGLLIQQMTTYFLKFKDILLGILFLRLCILVVERSFYRRLLKYSGLLR
jgi:hypothetical protein